MRRFPACEWQVHWQRAKNVSRAKPSQGGEREAVKGDIPIFSVNSRGSLYCVFVKVAAQNADRDVERVLIR
jgi:hypothetical protein